MECEKGSIAGKALQIRVQWRVQRLMAKKPSQISMDKWNKENWRTISGKPSIQGPDATGEAYMPSEKAKRLKGTLEGYRRNKRKREAIAKGKQYASYKK